MSTIYHIPKGTPYHRENSLRGIRLAHALGFPAIDLDFNLTFDGVLANTHWDMPLLKDGFIDPLGKTGKRRRVRTMTWQHLRRLRTRDGYRINSIRTVLRECARLGVVAWIEPKADRRFEDPALWRKVARIAEQEGAEIRGYSIRHLGGRNAGVRRVAAMKAAGIRAHVIH